MSWLCNCLVSGCRDPGEGLWYLFGLWSRCHRGIHNLLDWRLVTKPMFEFEFEGELLPFIVNGDRFELLALLPRRKPRTERDIAAAIFPFRGQPSLTAVTITSRVGAMSIGFMVLGCGGVSATAMQPHPQRGGGLPPAVFVFVSADAVAVHKAPPSAIASIQRERPLYRLEHRCRNR